MTARARRGALAGWGAALALAAPAHGAWTDSAGILTPSPTATDRLGPPWADSAGRAQAVLRGDDAADPWALRTILTGAPAGEAALGVPPGLVPVAGNTDGALLAVGIVAVPAGPVLAAARRTDGVWEAPRALSAPLAPDAAVAPAAAVGPDGTAAVAWLEGAVARVSVLDGDRLVALAAPGAAVPVVRIDDVGGVLALWSRPVAGGEALAWSRRPRAGVWSAARPAPTPRRLPAGALSFDVDVTGPGQAVLAWSAGGAGAHRIWWSLLVGGRTGWTTSAAIGGPAPGGRVEAVRTSVAGDAVAFWSTTTRTESTTRVVGADRWSADGPVLQAPGRGRAARAPLQVVADRSGLVTVGWALRDGFAVSSRSIAPGPWPAPDVHPTVLGPLGIRLGTGRGGDVVVSWAVTSGVASGRVGVAARDGAGGPPLTGLAVRQAASGAVARVGLAAPGRVVLEAHRPGTGEITGAVIADLPAGSTDLPLPARVTATVTPGATVLLRARTAARDPGAGVASVTFTTPR